MNVERTPPACRPRLVGLYLFPAYEMNGGWLSLRAYRWRRLVERQQAPKGAAKWSHESINAATTSVKPLRDMSDASHARRPVLIVLGLAGDVAGK